MEYIGCISCMTAPYMTSLNDSCIQMIWTTQYIIDIHVLCDLSPTRVEPFILQVHCLFSSFMDTSFSLIVHQIIRQRFHFESLFVCTSIVAMSHRSQLVCLVSMKVVLTWVQMDMISGEYNPMRDSIRKYVHGHGQQPVCMA